MDSVILQPRRKQLIAPSEPASGQRWVKRTLPVPIRSYQVKLLAASFASEKTRKCCWPQAASETVPTRGTHFFFCLMHLHLLSIGSCIQPCGPAIRQAETLMNPKVTGGRGKTLVGSQLRSE